MSYNWYFMFDWCPLPPSSSIISLMTISISAVVITSMMMYIITTSSYQHI